MDSVSAAVRSRIMAAVPRADTAPELAVRSCAHRLGLRFRLGVALPGRPDVVFPGRRAVLFVHGCFWHHHSCTRGSMPKSRPDYWAAKFDRNVARDAAAKSALEAQGWTVHVVWECETKNAADLTARLRALFGLAEG